MSAEAEAALTGSGIRKGFGSGEARVQVLHGIDVAIRRGEVTFLVGPSGCGKTTLISILAGILTPDDGRVALFGQDLFTLGGNARARLRRERIGFIFQQFNLLPTLTAAENASVPLRARGVPAAKAQAAAVAMLGRLGMEAQVDRLPKELSGGQQQRVAIARALVHEPKLVVCDEPTASLDAATGQTVMQLLRDVGTGPDRAVVVVTHDNRIYDFADRILHMADGRLVRDEPRTARTGADAAESPPEAKPPEPEPHAAPTAPAGMLPDFAAADI